jgi:hypothetical protein
MKCRNCGKPIRKATVLIYVKKERTQYDRPSGLLNYLYVGNDRPKTWADCQKLTNQKIVAINYGKESNTVHSFYTWDGTSYLPQFDYFCTNRCAGQFGRLAVTRGFQP